jgi:hypothetical protein
MVRRFLAQLWEWYLVAFERGLRVLTDALGLDLEADERPPDSVVVICSCAQKNHVRREDFNRAPICRKCRRMLRLPS